jgi:hypothetical protein
MRQIKDYLDYLITLDGKVFSIISMKFLKPNSTKTGYLSVELYDKKGGSRRRLIHRLVAETYLPNLEKKEQVNHINGIKSDNCLLNLEWNTSSENNKHAFRTGLRFVDDKRRQMGHELKERRKKLVLDLETGIYYSSMQEAAESVNLHFKTLSAMLTGRKKNNTNFKYV